MKRICLLAGLLIVCCGCATPRHDDLFGASVSATNPRVVELGLYRVQVGTDGTNDTVSVTKGDEKLFSKTENKVSVYFNGRSLFDYACSGPGNVLAAYMVHIRDAKGNIAFTLMDENADGVFDRKIDYGTKAIYEWKDNQWVTAK